MAFQEVAAAAARGLLAGLAGTAAMTLSSSVEARLSGRGTSTTPAQAVESLTGVQPRREEGQQRLNTAAHWAYGTALGVERGLLGLTGLHGPAATAAHLALAWGASQGLLPALDVSPPTWHLGARATSVDVLHHVVYATATGLAHDWLDARTR
ncbi:MAG: hypothetical protein M3N17_03865 [Actinomycetota bacterium]|nr:hypothetical protein [Actinomycetota bacterium]